MSANTSVFRWARVGLAVLLFGVQLDGCAAGRARTGITPSGQPTPVALEQLDLTSLPPGSRLRIVLRGDSLVSGEFHDVSRMTPEVYGKRVAAFREARTDSILLPSPGSKIQVRRGSKNRSALLDGYGYRSLELRWQESSRPEVLPFDRFAAVIDSSGHVWTRDALDTELMRGHVPCFTVIEVDADSGRAQVPADQVVSVAYRAPSGHWVMGAQFFVGAVVILVMASRQKASPGPSCDVPPGTFYLAAPACAPR